MKKACFVVLGLLLASKLVPQAKTCGKSATEKAYSYTVIYGGIKALIDKPLAANFFKDDYFNDLLRNIVLDKKFSDKEKVQMFYLMQKKIGYAFSGVSYLPPEQNYFNNHQGKVYTYQKTLSALKGIDYNAAAFFRIAETYRTTDAILASNALLLGTLISPDSAVKKLEFFTRDNVIKEAKNPNVFNHYVCLSASLVQDSIVVKNLLKDLESFTSNEWIEDVLCTLYSKSNPLAQIKTYIQNEKNEKNGLAIQTALSILYTKLSEATYDGVVQRIHKSLTEKWKKDIVASIMDRKYPYNYSLASPTKIVTKVWEGVSVQPCPDGLLIVNGTLTEFDANN